MSKITLGGDRLGSGNKQKVDLHNYSRSTHDLSYIWRSTMASGTLVPFMSEVALPGDNFDINLDVDIKTHPTIGPLFGSYKVQLDVFTVPVRLYNGKLHMNMLNIGLNMSKIKLPQLRVQAKNPVTLDDNEQVNPSALLSYLNIRGLGINPNGNQVDRNFNAIPLLAYWDIYKNYYANKQESRGVYVHNRMGGELNTILNIRCKNLNGESYDIGAYPINPPILEGFQTNGISAVLLFSSNDKPIFENIIFNVYEIDEDGNVLVWQYKLTELFNQLDWNGGEKKIYCQSPKNAGTTYSWSGFTYDGSTETSSINSVQLATFPLDNIDEMKKLIFESTGLSTPFYIDEDSDAPYGTPLIEGNLGYPITSTQEGLGIKTYQSDLFNNWISTEWIDGENGINAITAVDTSSGEFTINSLQLSNKVYDMLNRIAVSGGSYDDWLNAVYSHERTRSIENPMYMGGLIKELGFQEVVSNAAAVNQDTEQPLGTLAGRGVLTNKKKGGNININIHEPSYIMGIISLTPRVDYSQGNKWDVNLKTMDDFHKPALDEIGFQDLITDQMAWFDTVFNDENQPVFKSAGKQPAWLNYMTNVNITRGNFAEKGEQMFMTLNRRYEQEVAGEIKDLTTYIDPKKFNNIFADTRLDAQNFWAQIAVNIKARRKMSAKIMPNL